MYEITRVFWYIIWPSDCVDNDLKYSYPALETWTVSLSCVPPHSQSLFHTLRPSLHWRGCELEERSLLFGGEPLTHPCSLQSTLHLSIPLESLNFLVGLQPLDDTLINPICLTMASSSSLLTRFWSKFLATSWTWQIGVPFLYIVTQKSLCGNCRDCYSLCRNLKEPSICQSAVDKLDNIIDTFSSFTFLVYDKFFSWVSHSSPCPGLWIVTYRRDDCNPTAWSSSVLVPVIVVQRLDIQENPRHRGI